MALTRAMSVPAPVAEEARIVAAMASRLCAALASAETEPGLKSFLEKGRAELARLSEDAARDGAVGEDWISVSGALCRAGEDLALAFGDMGNWAVEPEGGILRLAELLREMLERMAAALASSGASAQSGLAEAKGKGLELQAVFRRARGAALDSGKAVEGLKLCEVFRRFSDASAAADKAIERLAWILAEGGRGGGSAH